MLTDSTKTMVKFWCGTPPNLIAQQIKRSECFVSRIITKNVTYKLPEYVEERKLFTGVHYAEMCWFKLYLDEVLKDRKSTHRERVLDRQRSDHASCVFSDT